MDLFMHNTFVILDLNTFPVYVSKVTVFFRFSHIVYRLFSRVNNVPLQNSFTSPSKLFVSHPYQLIEQGSQFVCPIFIKKKMCMR